LLAALLLMLHLMTCTRLLPTFYKRAQEGTGCHNARGHY